MSRSAVVLVLVVLCGCKSSSRTVDVKSKTLKDKALKLAMVKDYAQGPTVPLETEFHLVHHDNSGGMIPGPDDFTYHIVVKVKPDDVAQWARGCERVQLPVRPSWADSVLMGNPEFAVNTKPDTVRCGREERVIHVKEGVIFRSITTMEN